MNLRLKKGIGILVLLYLLIVLPVEAVTDSNTSNNQITLTIDVIETRNLSLFFTSVNDIDKFTLVVDRNAELLKDTFPVSDNALSIVKDNSKINAPSSLSSNLQQLSEELEQLRLDILTKVFLSKQKFTSAVGIIEEDYLSPLGATGLNFNLGGADVLLVDETQIKTLSHEVGHTFELCEEYNRTKWRQQNSTLSDGCPNGDFDKDGDLDDACLNNPVGTGCPTSTLSIIYENYGNISENTQLRSFMGSSDTPLFIDLNSSPINFETWVSNDTYDALIDKLVINSSFEIPTIGFKTAPGKYLVVRARYYINSTVQFLRSFILEDGFINDAGKFSGNSAITILNESGGIISNISFEPTFSITTEDGGEIETNSTIVIFSLPLNNQTISQILFKNSTSNLLEVNRTPNSPNVSILSPLGGEKFSSSFNITWNASDADNDTIEYAVFLSENNGSTYTTLDFDLNQTFYEINAADFEIGNKYKIKILGTDGINTENAISNGTFSIVEPPRINVTNFTILYQDGSFFVFEVELLNSGGQVINDTKWSMNLGEEVVESNTNFSMSINKTVTVFVAHNFTTTDIFTIITTGSSPEHQINDTQTIKLTLGDLIVHSLKELYSNSTLKIFEFNVLNNINTTIQAVSWNFNTGEGIVNSDFNVNLTPNETMTVIFEHDYASSGNYTITANATNGTIKASNSETINVS